MKASPRFASALSTTENLASALEEASATALAQLRISPDLAMVFVSADRAEQCPEIAARLCELLETTNLLGCTAESLVGVGREVEGETGLSLWLAHLPGVTLAPMHLKFERTPEGGLITGWPDGYATEWPEGTSMLCLGEPFTFPADMMLERLNEDRPGVPVIGGMASGAASPGENRLILGREVFAEGAVGCLLSGALRVRTVLSQGCRPIGKPLIVTRCDRNVIYELGGRPALLALKELFDTLPNQEKELALRGLHLGRVVSEYLDRFEAGDFLVRNVMGTDPSTGAVVAGDYFRVGQTVQFHLRDGRTADDDLKQCLATAGSSGASSPQGALLFTCNGRGMRLFGEPDHDATAIQEQFGAIPLAGFFAQGELGPIAGKNFMHGFTASLALFEGME